MDFNGKDVGENLEEGKQSIFRIFENFHLKFSENASEEIKTDTFVEFNFNISTRVDGFNNYYGPPDLGEIFKFVDVVELCAHNHPGASILWQVSSGSILTTSVFLIGAYMIVKLNVHADRVATTFQPLAGILATFCDVSPGTSRFRLELVDCWSALWRAKNLGWIKCFDPLEYAHFADPLNADLHEVVPGKFVAMRGPVTIPGGRLYRDVTTGDRRFSHRELSPQHYVEVLRNFDVLAVVRLNAPEYDPASFTREGLAFLDLYFEDCSCPGPDVVAKFLRVAAAVPGAIAVHCKAGLGRAGTLIATYMMLHHGFSAREAIGWLRIVRPGSVIGPQQDYLVAREAVLRRCEPPQPIPTTGPATVASAVGVARAIEEIVRDVDARARAFRAAPRSTCDDSAVPGRASTAVAQAAACASISLLCGSASSSLAGSPRLPTLPARPILSGYGGGRGARLAAMATPSGKHAGATGLPPPLQLGKAALAAAGPASVRVCALRLVRHPCQAELDERDQKARPRQRPESSIAA